MTIPERLSLFFATLFFKGMGMARSIKEGSMSNAKAAAPGKIYEFEMKTIDGALKPLSQYKGQVLLLVNVASRCGFTPQYEGLEALQLKYRDRGLRVLGFPANNFGAQEPGADSEIKQFCRTKFSVSFDLFSKISVKGPDIHPLYRFLTSEAGHNGEVPWNFSKFLVARDGAVAARFGPDAAPESKALVAAVEGLLAAGG